MFNHLQNHSAISFVLEEQVVHLPIQCELLRFISTTPDASFALATEIKELHKTSFQTKLAISTYSLSNELLIHVYVYILALQYVAFFEHYTFLPFSKKFIRFFHKIEHHCKTIDCGSKQHDTNRFAFDLLIPFYTLIKYFVYHYMKKIMRHDFQSQ